jgi:ADP-ribosylglycohydrolase
MSVQPDREYRLDLARLSLDGLSVGDAFGQQFFADLPREIATRTAPLSPWQYTDDTEMALAIFEVLRGGGMIDQDRLARQFARRYMLDAARGYGAGARMILQEIADGTPWYVACRQIFGGQGSLGNGAAMRVAPLGAYFAADVPHVIDQAAASAEITHAHPEGIAGAVAVGLAAAWATRRGTGVETGTGGQMLEHVLAHSPDSAVRRGIERALAIPLDEWEFNAANVLGNGSQITAADTVPFCLWCAAAHLDSYEDALWAAARVGGDIDTNGAIVGGIVAMAVGRQGIPIEWLRAREELVFLGE